MPGQHRDPTISFRATQWERAMIEERVRSSGLYGAPVLLLIPLPNTIQV